MLILFLNLDCLEKKYLLFLFDQCYNFFRYFDFFCTKKITIFTIV